MYISTRVLNTKYIKKPEIGSGGRGVKQRWRRPSSARDAPRRPWTRKVSGPEIAIKILSNIILKTNEQRER